MSTTDPGCSLLEGIMALGEDAFVAWEKLCSEYDVENVDKLLLAPCVANGMHLSHICEGVYSLQYPAVITNGRYMAVYMQSIKQWVPRLPEDGDDAGSGMLRRALNLVDQHFQKQ